MSLTDDSVTPGELPAIEEEALWVEHLPALITGVKVQGKTDGSGASNFQARVLDARTRFLKKQFADLLVNGVNVLGTLENEAALEAIPTEGLSKGTAYFVEGALRIWNGTEWASSGSLVGARGINLLGKHPDAAPLPDPAANKIGDAYIWKSDVWILSPAPDNWVSIGLKGDNGKSAYEIAVENGETGTEDQWLTKLVGKSAYDIWLAKGNIGTEDEFLDSLKGKDGGVGNITVLGTLNSFAELDALPTEGLKNGNAYFVEGGISIWNETEWVHSGSLLGPRGITLLGTWPNGNSLPSPEVNTVGDAYIWKSDIWLLVPTNGDNPPEWVSIGLEGPEGISAYQVALNNGFVGTQPAWLASLVGKSAYQIWQGQGNTGSQADFIASLVGDNSFEIWLKQEGNEGKTLNDFFEAYRGKTGIQWKGAWDKDVPYNYGDTVGHNGSSWFSTLTFANTGREPTVSTAGWGLVAMKGDKGSPATPFAVMGAKAKVEDLPRPGNATEAWYVGSVLYIWVEQTEDYIDLGGVGGLSAYELAKQDGFAGTLQEWLASLVGKSTYEIWLGQGNTGDKDAFIRAQRGESSYQAWRNQGNQGTEEDFVASLKSTTPGPAGPARAPFSVMGTKATEALLPTPGKETEAWFVGQNLYVWVESVTQYADIGSMGGLDAYQVAVGEGFVGTVQEWLASLKSTVAGPRGPAGKNLLIKGTVANAAALDGINNPEEGDSYVARDTNHLHSFQETPAQWNDLGPFKGTDGKSAYQIWLDNGHTGSEQEFVASLQGKDGKDGINVVVRGSVSTFSELPANPEEQWVYSVRDFNTLYCWVNNAWIDLGSFRGQDGNNGKDGSSIDIIKILTPEDQTIPPAAANAGKAYITLDKRIMLSAGGVWTDGGPVGVEGQRGETGTGIKLRDTVDSVAGLPSKTSAAEGDGYFIRGSKMLYVLTDGEWAGPFDITGLPGVGLPGKEGPPGKSINVLGAYPTLEALAAAHPTGNLGDGYLIGSAVGVPRDLGIWSTEDGGKWINVGVIEGPRGPQGEQGPIGVGKKGDRGERGSVWITLPAGQDAPAAGFTGLVGDWAVSSSFKVYYKTADQGWVYWGQLVAGDVNSPVQSLGKVVRLGNDWVPLLVDEAPNMIDGRAYVRMLIDGSTDNEGEWVELQFPDPFDDAPADGKMYLRTRALNAAKGTWTPLGVFVTEAPNDGKLYGRSKPADAGTPGSWKPIPDSIADIAVKDGKLYARSFATDGTTPVWKEFTTIADLLSKDGKQYARVFESAGSAPIWKEIVAPTFDRYTVKLLSAVSELDLSLAQTFSFNASVARTITFKAGTVPAADRSMVVVLIINGAGSLTWPSTITWHQNTQPVLGATTTIVTLVWDGIGIGGGGRWIGSAGATV